MTPRTPDPRIGVLIRDGAEIFYAFHNGYSQPPVQGSLSEVEVALGICPTLQEGSSVVPRGNVKSRDTQKGAMRSYDVTIKPSVTLYSGSFTYGEHIERVDARNRREAEKTVRRRLQEVNGRHAPKYNISARPVEDS